MDEKIRICRICKKEKPIKEFPIERSICRKCKYLKNKEYLHSSKDVELRTQEYFKKYYGDRRDSLKVKSYRNEDKKKNREYISLLEFRELVRNHPYCFYCGEEDITQLGLDRRDNNLGHCASNVEICCEKCNNLLSDIPFEAKILLKEGLKEIKRNNLLKDWVIPTKRKKSNV